jgi:adenine phosphoribosyltransferase
VLLDYALGLISEVPDFPEPGVLFRDLTPLFANAQGFATVVDALGSRLDSGVELLAAVEARGFLLAAALGYARGLRTVRGSVSVCDRTYVLLGG